GPIAPQVPRPPPPDGPPPARPRALDPDFHFPHAVLRGCARRPFRGLPRGERRALAGPLEAGDTRRRPGNHVPLFVGNGHNGVVERRLDVRDAARHVLSLTPPRPGTFSRSRQANRLPLLLLLSAHGTPRTLAGARVGARPLAAHGQTAAVAQAPVAADVHQPLDVHLHAATQVAFHLVVGGDKIAQTVGFLLGQVPHLRVGIHARRPKNLLGAGTANAVNVRQPNDDPLVAGQ